MSQKNKTFGHGGSPPCTCDRRNNPVKPVQISGHTIWAGGGLYLREKDLVGFDHWIDLRAEQLPPNVSFGDYLDKMGVIYLPIVDFGTVADEDWGAWKMVLDVTQQQMAVGIKKVVFCAGGHGRTGLFLASLLAKSEPKVDDPVAEIRRRYCPHAVETEAQRAQVMRLLKETRRCNAAPTS